MTTVISVEHLSKTYRLGQIGTGTFSRDLEVWWAKLRGKPNPLLRIGETDPAFTAKGAKNAKEESGLRGSKNQEDNGTIWALKDINFTVEQGEVLGIIGKNGAGKSTLLKILSRVTAPTSGKVKVKGRIASLLEVGTGFHPELTGRENIYLNGAILGMNRREIDRKFDEIVDFAEVEKFIDTPVKRYSSGMYVRLAFAVAAHLDPEILVVDEVLAVGDAAFQKKCLGKMGEVAKEGRTVLFVSHNMAAVSSLCNNGLVLQTGCISYAGSTERAISEYISNQSMPSETLLSDRSDRTGNGAIRFTRYLLWNRESKISIVQCGSPIEIILEYESKELTQLSDLKVAIVFSDSLGRRLSTCSMEHNIVAQKKFPTIGQIICNIDRFPLLHGRYYVLLWSSVNGQPADRIENAFYVDVAEGDFFGSGKLPRPEYHGSFLIDHSWRIEEIAK